MEDMHAWVRQLASDAPAPGGGGASALTGACAAALGAMVAHLTAAGRKYESVREEMLVAAEKTEEICEHMFALIDRDREAFLPLAEAYRIPKEDPERPGRMEAALRTAAGTPLEMLRTAVLLPPLLADLLEKGSRLAVSDVGCAASLCISAAETAYLNVLVNTALMKDRGYAAKTEEEAASCLNAVRKDCVPLYEAVLRTIQR